MLALTDATVAFSSPGGPQVRAVDGITLALPAGQFVVVVGTNGSGKSTLLGAIAGTVPLDVGRIELAGRNITRWRASPGGAHRPRVSGPARRHGREPLGA